jgi:hypothetical protein
MQSRLYIGKATIQMKTWVDTMNYLNLSPIPIKWTAAPSNRLTVPMKVTNKNLTAANLIYL